MLEPTRNSNPATIESSDTKVNGALRFCNDFRLRRVGYKNSRTSLQRLTLKSRPIGESVTSLRRRNDSAIFGKHWTDRRR